MPPPDPASDQQRDAAAAHANALLIRNALIRIRAMAYLREDLVADELDEPPGDYHERIRLLADACHNLPGTHRPLGTLQYTWNTANEFQRTWIRRILASHDIAITDLVTDERA